MRFSRCLTIRLHYRCQKMHRWLYSHRMTLLSSIWWCRWATSVRTPCFVSVRRSSQRELLLSPRFALPHYTCSGGAMPAHLRSPNKTGVLTSVVAHPALAGFAPSLLPQYYCSGRMSCGVLALSLPKGSLGYYMSRVCAVYSFAKYVLFRWFYILKFLPRFLAGLKFFLNL